jgi:hypothetical protein
VAVGCDAPTATDHDPDVHPHVRVDNAIDTAIDTAGHFSFASASANARGKVSDSAEGLHEIEEGQARGL